MINRVNLILRTKNLSPSLFADEIGVQRSSISHILSGRNNPSLEFVTKVLSRFPEIETDWLIFGKGAMYKDAHKQQKSGLEENEEDNLSFVEQDLFSQSLEKSEATGNKATSTPPPQAQEEGEGLKKNIQDEISENPVLPPPSQEKIIYSNLKKEKSIEKFVILYTDKTFREYYPE